MRFGQKCISTYFYLFIDFLNRRNRLSHLRTQKKHFYAETALSNFINYTDNDLNKIIYKLQSFKF